MLLHDSNQASLLTVMLLLNVDRYMYQNGYLNFTGLQNLVKTYIKYDNMHKFKLDSGLLIG